MGIPNRGGTKKDGTLRLCVDYWKLNGASQQDVYPMPTVDEVIDRIGKARFITMHHQLGERILAGSYG